MDGEFWTGDLYIDQKQKSYQDLGFKKYSLLGSIKSIFAAKTKAALTRANEKKIKGNMKGEVLQIGGTLLISKGGEKLLFEFKQESAGDHIPLETVLEAFGIAGSPPESGATAGQPKKKVVCDDDVCQMK